MNIGETVIPNEENEEEDLTRCNPNYGSLPAIRLSKGVWLARWTLNEAERKIIAETGDIYIRMHAIDGDELVMPHSLFVDKPDLRQLKAYYDKSNELVVNSNVEASPNEKPELPSYDKSEIRLLIQEEINKAFRVALHAALNYSVSISDSVSMEKGQERQRQNIVISEIGKAVENALRDLKDEADASIVEKTDPARPK